MDELQLNKLNENIYTHTHTYIKPALTLLAVGYSKIMTYFITLVWEHFHYTQKFAFTILTVFTNNPNTTSISQLSHLRDTILEGAVDKQELNAEVREVFQGEYFCLNCSDPELWYAPFFFFARKRSSKDLFLTQFLMQPSHSPALPSSLQDKMNYANAKRK